MDGFGKERTEVDTRVDKKVSHVISNGFKSASMTLKLFSLRIFETLILFFAK